MPRKTWETVGGFDQRYRWHLDNEWLGRLNKTKIARIHLIDATVPASPDELIKERPELAKLLRFGGRSIRLARHRLPFPLVTRLVHSGSGMHQIRTNPIIKSQSDAEYRQLRRRLGRIPW